MIEDSQPARDDDPGWVRGRIAPFSVSVDLGNRRVCMQFYLGAELYTWVGDTHYKQFLEDFSYYACHVSFGRQVIMYSHQ